MWLDLPFFGILEEIGKLQSFFMSQAHFIGKIVTILALGLAAIKCAINGSGIKDSIVRFALAFVFYMILINAYPSIIKHLNLLVYEWSYNSTYTTSVFDTLEDARNNDSFWQKLANEKAGASNIITQVEIVDGSGNLGHKYILDIYDVDTGFMRPNAVMRLVMLIVETIFNQAKKHSFWHAEFWMLSLTWICVLLCGAIASIQYFLCAIEWSFLTAVGVIMLPFMLWESTKHMSEKLFSAIIGFALRVLFISIAMLLAINGYLAILTRDFSGGIDQVVYTIFLSLFYLALCKAAPQLASALQSGAPSMSMGGAAAGAIGMMGAGAGLAATGMALAKKLKDGKKDGSSQGGVAGENSGNDSGGNDSLSSVGAPADGEKKGGGAAATGGASAQNSVGGGSIINNASSVSGGAAGAAENPQEQKSGGLSIYQRKTWKAAALGAAAFGGAIAGSMAMPLVKRAGQMAAVKFGANLVRKTLGIGAQAIGAARQARKEGGKAGHVVGAAVHSLAHNGAQTLKEQVKKMGAAFAGEKYEPKQAPKQSIGDYLESQYANGKSHGAEYMDRRNNSNGVPSQNGNVQGNGGGQPVRENGAGLRSAPAK
jgi:type IV secretory pathway TrbL component